MFYINYHLHSENSNPVTQADSAENPDTYLKRIHELGHTAYCSTEHGVSCDWVGKYLKVKQFNKENKTNIKFVYAVEAYVEYSEKVYHLMLLAKNMEGLKEINRSIYDARDNIKNRRPRLTLDNLNKNIKGNVVATTACLGGVFKEPTGGLLKGIAQIFKRDLWIEIAPHQSPIQKELNIRAIGFATKYNLTLVTGNDSHYVYPYGKKDRDDLLLSKGLVYEDEGDFYMDYPSYDEVIKRYQIQGVVSKEIAMQSLDNTMKIMEFGDIELNEGGEFKVPTVFPDLTRPERCCKLIEIINERWTKYAEKYVKTEDRPKYAEAIKKELHEVFECKMEDFFLTSMIILERGIELGGVITKSNRGSSSSFFINNLLGFTSIDRIKSKVPILMERFMTGERILLAKTSPDIDNNVGSPEPFIEAQKEILGEHNGMPMIAFGTLKAKSAFKMLCRARGNVPIDLQNTMSKAITEYENDMMYASDDERLDIHLETYMNDDDLYELYQAGESYFGMIMEAKAHPCGFLVSNDNLIDLIGVAFSSKGIACLNLQGCHAEKLGYLKLDWLTVSVVDLIDKIYKEIGIPQPNASDLYDLVKDDEATWDVYSSGATLCVNQVEQPKTIAKSMNYKPRTVEDLCAFIAGIRPGFSTFYKRFANREEFSFDVPAVDDLLRGDYSKGSWLLYQEHVMLILEWSGFEPKKTYETLKGIGKKKIELIMAAKDQFLRQCKEHIIAEGLAECDAIEKSQNIWKVIENSAAYSFNSSHSYGMAHDSLWVAYAKAHYPLQTYKTCLKFCSDRKEKSKVAKLKNEAIKFYNIIIPSPKFRQDNRRIYSDAKSRTIYMDLSSIKHVGDDFSDSIYNIRDTTYDFIQIYANRSELNLDRRALYSMAKIGYFSEFGIDKSLLMIIELYKDYKSLNKSKISSEYLKYSNYTKLSVDEFETLCYNTCDSETKSMLRFTDPTSLFREIFKTCIFEESADLERLFWEVDLTGTHEEELKDDSIIGVVQVKSKDSYSKKSKLCVLDVKTNQQRWITIDKLTDCEAKDVVYIPKIKTTVTKSGFINNISTGNINLTNLFDEKKRRRG